MPSLAEKMSSLVDEYNHSKNSPSYRKLNTKYKALKATNAELIQLLTNIFSELNSNRNVSIEQKNTSKPKSIRNKLRRSQNVQTELFDNEHDVVSEETEQQNDNAVYELEITRTPERGTSVGVRILTGEYLSSQVNVVTFIMQN